MVSSHVLVQPLSESRVMQDLVPPGHHGHPGQSVHRHAGEAHGPGSESVARAGTMESVRVMMRRLRLVMMTHVQLGLTGLHGHSVHSLVGVVPGRRYNNSLSIAKYLELVSLY